MGIPAFIPGQKCGCGGKVTPRNGIYRCDVCYSSYGRHVIKVEDILDSIHNVLAEIEYSLETKDGDLRVYLYELRDQIDAFKKQGE